MMKLNGYDAAYRVELYRDSAERLREAAPETYDLILGAAEGKAASAASEDPDAYVALYLAFSDDVEGLPVPCPKIAGGTKIEASVGLIRARVNGLGTFARQQHRRVASSLTGRLAHQPLSFAVPDSTQGARSGVGRVTALPDSLP